MTESFRITLGQMNPTAGDLAGNATMAHEAWQIGRTANAQMVALPEMFLTGAVGTLLQSAAFLRDVYAKLEDLAQTCADGPALGIGAPWQEGDKLFNAYLILQDGKIAQRVLKHRLADHEATLFDAGPISGPYGVAGLRIGSPIGTDAEDTDVAETLEETGADILLVPDAAPYRRGVMEVRFNHTVARVVETRLPLIYLNQTGAEGPDVCDGASFALNPGGQLAQQLPAFETAVAHVDLMRGTQGWQVVPGKVAAQAEQMEQDYRALVVGLQDHLHKRRQSKVVLGLGGDACSALVASLAADAFGPAQLHCVYLPDTETEDAARTAAEFTATRLGCALDVAPLAALQSQIVDTFAPLQKGAAPQDGPRLTADLRTLVLQGLSHAIGAALLGSQNKTDVALGRSAARQGGQFAPICDLYESEASALCLWRNQQHRDWMQGPAGEVILLKAEPKATPADAILAALLDANATPGECIAAGHEQAAVESLAQQVFNLGTAGQTPPCGPRISSAKPPSEGALAARARWRNAR